MSRRDRWRKHNLPVVADTLPTTDLKQLKIGIDPPPDYIFKYRKNRVAPAQDLWGVSVSYIPLRAEYVNGEGNFVHYYGQNIPPSRTVAPIEAIGAINPVKRLMRVAFGVLSLKESRLPILSLILMGQKSRARLLEADCEGFNSMADTTLTPFYLEDGYYSKVVKEIRKFVGIFLTNLGVSEATAKKTGEVIGCLFEYDNAYRYRVHDLLNEASQEALIKDFPKEVRRLVTLFTQRDKTNDLTDKFQSVVKLLNYGWYIPRYRKMIQNSINAMDFKNCKLEPMDIYHVALYGDYDTQGKVLEERIDALRTIHGPDEAKWPPRIQIKSN